MKKFILSFFSFLIIFSAFSETKIRVTQSIRYGNGDFAPLDSPQISYAKAKKEGGKVFFRYDLEILDKGWRDGDTIIVSIKFPGEYMAFTDERFVKVTTLSGAESLDSFLLNQWSGTARYQELQKQVDRLPKIREWFFYSTVTEKDSNGNKIRNNIFLKSDIEIPLKLKNKEGNKAHIEFYIDLDAMADALDWHWERYKRTGDSKQHEFFKWFYNLYSKKIPISITFDATYENMMVTFFPKEGLGFDWFGIHSLEWYSSASKSDRHFTILMRE